MGERAIYPDAAAERLKRHAGKPYRPSNGSEGDYFAAMWCRDCRRRITADGNGCLIELNAWARDLGDPEYPREWVYGVDGQPCCTAFSDKRAPRPAYRCKATDDLFASHDDVPEVRHG